MHSFPPAPRTVGGKHKTHREDHDDKPRGIHNGRQPWHRRGIARALAKDGYDIAISYVRNAHAAEETLDAVRALGRRALAIRCDGEGNGNRAAIQEVVRELGRIDALVCNAGIYPYGDVTEMTDEQVDGVLGLNVRAVMIETIEAARHMTQGGRIVLIGSTFADRSPFPGISLYSASKSALNGFARGAARDLARAASPSTWSSPAPSTPT